MLEFERALASFEDRILMRSTGPCGMGILLGSLPSEVPCQGRWSLSSDQLDLQLYVTHSQEGPERSSLT